MRPVLTRKVSIGTKTILLLAGGLVAVSVTLTIMQYRMASRTLSAEWEDKSVESARILKLAVAPLLENGNYPALRKTVMQTMAIPGIHSLTVVNTNGIIVADSHEQRVGEKLTLHLETVRDALADARSDLSWTETTSTGRTRYILTPIRGLPLDAVHPGPVHGALLLGMDLSAMDTLLLANLRYLLFINGTTFAALFILLWLTIRIGLVQPLSALTRSMRSLPGVFPATRNPASASDEIQALAEAFIRLTEALEESESLNRAVLSSIAAHTALLDRRGYLLAVNPAWENFAKAHVDLFPYQGGGVVNYLEACQHPSCGYGESAPDAIGGIQAVLNGSRPQFSIEFRCPVPKQQRWFLLTATAILRESGGAIVSHLDITERKEVEARLREALAETEQAHSSLNTLYATIPIGLIYLNADLRIERVSQSASDIYGRRMEEQLGQPLSSLLPLDRWTRLQPILEQLLQTGKPYYGFEEIIPDLRAPEGVRYILSDYYPDRSTDGQIRGIHVVTQDITVHKHVQKEHERRLEELEAKNRELDQMAIRDPLTGLYNRRFFDEALAREWQQFQRTGDAFTVIIMDVDAFKAINDQYGHETGDRALVEVATTLRRTLRESDLVARVGGDEFAALLPRTDTDHSGPVADKLRDVLRRLRINTSLGAIPVSLSLGSATVPGFPPVTSAAELLRVADKRMYDAKRVASAKRSNAG